jgi:hypothetical protein
MIRNTFLFLGTFVAGALVALVVRAALFRPHADHQSPPPVGGAYAPMVTNSPAPAATAGAAASSAPVASQPPAAPVATVSPAAGIPVNTICAICGMEVDSKLPTAQYQGKAIGFGCKMCPPKFQADPDRYGPYYLRNEVYPK